MKKYLITTLLVTGLFLTGCSSDDSGSSNPSTNAPRVFRNLTFGTNAYFSTNGSMSAPVSGSQATAVADAIDITYIYNSDYMEPGFMDPVARSSQEWYWEDYYTPWLSTSVETRFYKTTLTKTDFDAAVLDETKIADCFASPNTIIAPHAIFPEGSCIGGRQSFDPESFLIREGDVFAFKNISSGKRGLIYIRLDQSSGWPIPFIDTNTKVDIIREN